MSLSIKETLAAKGIYPSNENLVGIEETWNELEKLKGDLEGVTLDNYDISLTNIAGGDHHE